MQRQPSIVSLDTELIAEAVEAARRVLEKNISARGLVASIDVYPEVWARDMVITFLGAAISKEPHILEAFRTSLELLASRQDRFGQIPFFVRLADDHTSYRSADSNPWFVIGACYYARLSGDAGWLQSQAPAILKALDWCESRDFAQTGLMESGECDDWADLLSNRGNVLFPNVLCAAACRLAARDLRASHPAEAAALQTRAETMAAAIQRVFRVAPLDSYEDQTHHRTRTLMSLTLRQCPYFLPWVGVFDFGERFDTTANLLAVITGAADPAQAEQILDFIRQTGLASPMPVRVLYPPIQPGDRDWRDYYKVWLNNMPDCYHNGGAWPWVGGLYVAALVHTGQLREAAEQLAQLARAIRAGKEKWECNEWLHGRTGEPMGSKYQAWSAGMFLYAKHAFDTGEIPGFVL